jgi:hypothetical protein
MSINLSINENTFQAKNSNQLMGPHQRNSSTSNQIRPNKNKFNGLLNNSGDNKFYIAAYLVSFSLSLILRSSSLRLTTKRSSRRLRISLFFERRASACSLKIDMNKNQEISRDLRDLFGAEILGLLLEDELHQIALVLERVTLGLQVEVVIPKGCKNYQKSKVNNLQVLVDLLRITVLLQQVAQNADSSHPQDLLRHTGVLGTATLTEATVTTLK